MKLSHASAEYQRKQMLLNIAAMGEKYSISIYNLHRVPHKNSSNQQICSSLEHKVVAASDLSNSNKNNAGFGKYWKFITFLLPQLLDGEKITWWVSPVFCITHFDVFQTICLLFNEKDALVPLQLHPMRWLY